jgi:hypothetical protein
MKLRNSRVVKAASISLIEREEIIQHLQAIASGIRVAVNALNGDEAAASTFKEDHGFEPLEGLSHVPNNIEAFISTMRVRS